ncbi:DNA-binding LacI/PurR family transcriptional regulator [Agromyces flavus]|uniref:DNA-binding LacI/PurR family transcriptional regulator n=1 Tax=Agromyces flavus TaxID=589382 RepID=A0A1H1X0D0_9MICO|nr:LacI family DNA-binding transcriptional regulator [Agromyces flavus]MCP2366287.1 DNA-binding LacI/PurR family transcriptional regulator [Agromyces flavus]GGI44372.1 LacI family transcriptional regulator [Agromyces flavus]SDT02126.1 DNA-binding transcriptional regulator, LacI/PurR family [Agromyces flavus]
MSGADAAGRAVDPAAVSDPAAGLGAGPAADLKAPDPAAAATFAGVPTMFDVARHAGVSHQTVSRVLNDLPGVAAATRERVRQAMAELNYAPSPTARAMARRRSGSIGLIQAGRPDYGPSSAALGFNEAAREAGYAVSQASMRALDADELTQAVHRLVLQRVEAIVLISGEREGVDVLRGIDAGVPVVAVASERSPGTHRVSFDQAAGARLATEHLIGLGHRRIAHVAGPADSMDAAERRRGFAAALEAHGLEHREPIEGDWLAASGHAAGVRVLEDGWATAVFVGNDQMSLGLLAACHAAGVAVPDDLSVVGFDDIPEAAFFTPALTTMRQDFHTLGLDIMATVLDVLRDEPSAPDRTTRVPELVVRASTAAPPRAADLAGM